MRLFIINLFVVMSLTICANAVAKEILPYKATTVDECINEKECVWFIFAKHLTMSDFESAQYENLKNKKAAISKWSEPVTVYFNDQSDKGNLLKIGKALKQIEPYFSYPITIDKNYNLLVMFSDDFKHDISIKYRSFFKKMLGDDRVFYWYNKYKSDKEVCFNLSFDDSMTGEVKGNIVFLNPKSQKLDYCVISTLYSSLGLTSGIDNFDYSFFSFKGDGNFSNLTKVDLFLIHLLYQPQFETGMKLKEAKIAFDKIYPSAIKSFKKIYKAN